MHRARHTQVQHMQRMSSVVFGITVHQHHEGDRRTAPQNERLGFGVKARPQNLLLCAALNCGHQLTLVYAQRQLIDAFGYRLALP